MAGMIDMVWLVAQSASGLGGVLKFFGLSSTMLWIIVVGVVVAIGAWWLIKFIYKHRDKAKELTMIRRMFASTSGGTAAGADPAKRVAIDNMRRSFEEGVEKFRAAGKNVYTLPWLLLAGPSGSGKTEAIRHCNVGFPPGLQSYLQGAGGTLNMHWWFTNDAVILDTAGRIFMESAGQGGGDEWRELLKMLKDVRQTCPINGMLLCIGVDSLIKDSGDDIQEKAGKIAQQLDTIQRVLDVRFPVFVVVTKCDLITGFREFFEGVTDPQRQHQMVGWSNPAPLDTTFNPEQVSEHIESVRQRLLRRRYALTVDPVHTDDPQARRTDQVDALYALPDSLARLSSRLRRYLELIFVQGEWSPKPLFLRGIYFTSSMRQGAELDEELAKMLGVSLDKLPGGATVEKSYFLRDVFKEKVFKEKGLVTRASNVDKQQSRQRLMVVGSAIAAAVVLLASTLYSSWDFGNRVQEPTTTWETLWARQAEMRVISSPAGGGALAYPTDMVALDGTDSRTRAGALARAKELAEKPESVPHLLKPISWFGWLTGGDVASGSRNAAAALSVRSAVAPLVEQAREKLRKREAADGSTWTPEATAVLTGLLRIERKDKGEVGTTPIDVDAFLKYVLEPGEYKNAQAESKLLQEVVAWAYADGGAEWPHGAEDRLSLGSDAGVVKRGVAAFNAHWKNPVGSSELLRKLMTLQAKGEAFEAAERDLKKFNVGEVKALREGDGSYESFEKSWREKFGALSAARQELEAARASANFSGKIDDLNKSITAAQDEVVKSADAAYAQVLDVAPAPGTGPTIPNLQIGNSAVNQAANQINQLGDAIAVGAQSSRVWPNGVLKEQQEALASARRGVNESVGAQIKDLRDKLTQLTQASSGVLARPESAGKFEFEKRIGAYSAASGAVAASAAPEAGKGPEWGELKVGEEARSKPFGEAFGAIKVEYPKATEGGEDAGSYSLGVVTLAQRALRTRATLAALRGTSGEPGWIKKRVGELAKAPPKDATPTVSPDSMSHTWDIPGMQFSLQFPEDFNPNGAALLLGDFAWVSGPKSAGGELLKDAEVERGVGAIKVAVRAYRAEYVREWTDAKRDAARSVSFDSWETALATMSKLGQNGPVVCDNLAALSKLMREALKVPGLVDVGEEDTLGINDRSKALGTDVESMSNGNTYRNEVVAALRKHYATMSQEPIAARRLIGGKSGLDFKEEFLGALTDDAPNSASFGGPGVVYWSRVRVAYFEALAAAYSKSGGGFDFEKDGLFPLRFDPASPRGGHLDTERVRKAIDALSGASRGATSGAATIRDGARTGVKVIDYELAKLFKPDAYLADRADLAKALRDWGAWIGENPTVTIVAIDDHGYNGSREADKLKGPDGREANIGGAIYTNLHVNDAHATNRNPGGTPLAKNIPVYAGGSAKLQFRMDNGAGLAASWSPVTPWQTLELLCQQGAEPAGASWSPTDSPDAASKKWLVPVFFKGQDGMDYFIRIGLEFSVEIPSRKVWPTGDKWK